MTDKKLPLFHADHVGSLLRPPELKQAYRAFSQGEISAVEFQEKQDNAIRQAIAMQEKVGLHSITDGEFRRISYWAKFVETVDGLTVKQSAYKFRDASGQEQGFLSPHVENKVRRTESIAGDEFDFLSQITTKTPKITLPSPPTMHFWRGREGVDATAYQDIDAYFVDLATVYRQEITDLAAMGARYIQIDDVPLPMLCDPDVRSAVHSAGDDADQLIERYIHLINDAMAACPDDMTVAMHLCRGNFKGRWLSGGGYEYIGERLFNETNVDVFFMEYDTPRAGDFAPLRFMPENKAAVLGIISSKVPELEDVDLLRRRIDEAAQYMPMERLGISPQCGFASTVGGNPITVEDEMNKLKLVVDTAKLVWGE